MRITKEDVCNLSRLPCKIEDNPCFLTALQIVENENIDYKDTPLYIHYKWQLKTLADIYNLNMSTPLDEYKYNAIFLPWIHCKPVTNHVDGAFFVATEDEIKKQIKKIKNLLSSFKEHGYDPKIGRTQRGGNIIGYFLKSGEKKKFYVVSGNHRVATWFALNPESSLPITRLKTKHMKGRDLENNEAVKEGSFPFIFDVDDTDSWASVKGGFLEKDIAIKIFNRYFGD
tara:strand:- start:6017 stop:6700 length:684 start_codon:yes stop_codon:yes gene_type:complete